jgi:FkbM family methyltransferase
MKVFNMVITRSRNVLPEEKLAAARTQVLEHCDFVIDIGANSGQWISNVRKHGYIGSALCIEPIKHIYDKLKSNKFPNTETLNCAVGNMNGYVTINCASNQGLSSSILELESTYRESTPNIHYVRREKTSVLKLSKILEGVKGEKLFIKIDTQGFEFEILKSLKQMNFDRIYAFEIEASLVRSYKGSTLVEDVIKYLRNKGYRPLRIENGFGLPNFGQQFEVDILFTKCD